MDDDKKPTGFILTPLKFLLIILGLALLWAWAGGAERFAHDSGIPFAPRENLKGGISFGAKNSPYKNMLFLTRIERARDSDQQREHISIKAASTNTTPLTLTGLSLGSGRNVLTTDIGQGALLPYAGEVSPLENIVIAPNEEAIVVSGRSPIGISFKVNKCSAYLGSLQLFTPSLPQACPSPQETLSRSEVRLDTACTIYVRSLSACAVPVSFPANLSRECRTNLLNVLTYNGCVNVHHFDPDFFSPEWRIYLGADRELWNDTKEIIKLLDTNGNIIDSIKY